MSKPSYINYADMPGSIMKGKVIPKVYYPSNNPSGNVGQKVLRFEIPPEKAFWDPYSVYIKMTIVPAKGVVPNTPGYFSKLKPTLSNGSVDYTCDVQSSQLEYLTKTSIYNPQGSTTNIAPPITAAQTIGTGANLAILATPTTSTFADTCLQLNDSFHSLWTRFICRSGNEVVENIENLDIISAWMRDVSYSPTTMRGSDTMGFYTGVPFSSSYSSVKSSTSGGIAASQYSNMLPNSTIDVRPASGIPGSDEDSGALAIGFKSMVSSCAYSLHKAAQLSSESSYLNNAITDGTVYVPFTMGSSDGKSSSAYILGYPTNLDTDAAFSSTFSAGTNEFFFTNLTVSSILNGQPFYNGASSTQQMVTQNPLTSIDVVVPFYSTLFGCMLPGDRYKWTPLHGVEDLSFEFIQNPNAFFTSYFGTNFADCAVTITKMEMNVNVIEYDDVALNNSVLSSLFQGKGITIPSMSWEFISTFPIVNGQVAGEYKCNRGFDSLKKILFGFLDDSWKTYTCYRKNWRLSHNVSKLWLRFGNELFPSLPFEGNAGSNLGSPNNSEFYYNLCKCFSGSPMLITQGNYALDSRPYNFSLTDVSAVQADMITKLQSDNDGKVLANVIMSYTNILYGSNWTLNSLAPVNGKTNLQACFKYCGNSQGVNYWENAVVGRALFAIDLDEDSIADSTISGYNTNASKPWTINIEQQIASSFVGKSTMYVFGQVNVGYQFKGGRIYRSGIN